LLNLQAENPMLEKQRSKHPMLPLLIVLFLVSYGLMTMLIVEQGRTIDTQRTLIRELFQDSARLTAMKANELHKRQAEARAKAKPQAQAQTPSSQVGPHDQASSDRSTSKLRKPIPPKPPKDTSDTADERRSVDVI
jgi:hypothetical protein